jgi:hypothetical protein
MFNKKYKERIAELEAANVELNRQLTNSISHNIQYKKKLDLLELQLAHPPIFKIGETVDSMEIVDKRFTHSKLPATITTAIIVGSSIIGKMFGVPINEADFQMAIKKASKHSWYDYKVKMEENYFWISENDLTQKNDTESNA